MLALIAGEGQLPVQIANTCAASGRPLHVCELEGFPSSLSYIDRIERFRIERLGSFFDFLKNNGVDEVVFAGAIRRPRLDPSAIDAATQKFVPRMLQAIKSGDDAALRIVLALFEEQGFAIRAAHEIVPTLLPDLGVLSDRAPDQGELADCARGASVIEAISSADVGQACIVKAGQVIAVEAAPGTDWMLRALRAYGLPSGVPDGGILVKRPKKGQDLRIDLPTIGPDTLDAAAKAGLTGIAVEANGVMMLDQEVCRQMANAAGLALWVFEAP